MVSEVKRAAGAAGRNRANRPTRERILLAGVELFQRRGYHGTGLAAILARAKAPKGSFYHHFPGGKEDLAIAALRWLEGEVTGFLDQLLAVDAGAGELITAMARYTAEGLRHGKLPRGSLPAVLAQEASPEAPAIAAAVKAYADSVRARLAKAYSGTAGGDAADFADRAMAVVEGAAVIARIEQDADRATAIVAAWLAAEGLAAPPGRKEV
jgi:TetR/AcrR family transcriptional repressor of lmrAB and yxaGH operons